MEQHTQDWLDLRKTKITATDAPVLMGANPFESPYQRWRKKLELDSPEPENEAMIRGKLLEPIAREQLMRQLNVELLPVVRISHKNQWAMASLDGLSPDGKILVEIKCPTTPREEVVPKMYYPQLQHQLYVCELEKMYYFNFFEGNTFLLEVVRDDFYIDQMLEVEAEFYECMQNFTPPKLTSKDYVERNDEEWMQAANEWKEISSTLKQLEEREKSAREKLIDLCKNINCKGSGISLMKIIRKGSIDYSRIPQIQNIDLEQYRKPFSESWRIV